MPDIFDVVEEKYRTTKEEVPLKPSEEEGPTLAGLLGQVSPELGRGLANWLGRREAPIEAGKVSDEPEPTQEEHAREATLGLVGGGKGPKVASSKKVQQVLQSILDTPSQTVPIEELAKHIPKTTKGPKLQEKMAERIADRLENVFDTVKNATSQGIKGFANAGQFGEWDEVIRKHAGELQMASLKNHEFGKAMKDKFKDIGSREALTLSMQAGGDTAKLQQWANDPTLHKGMRRVSEKALKLTPEEAQFGKKIRTYFDDMWNKANEEGLVESFVENYLPGLYKQDSKLGTRLTAQVHGGMLAKKPFFAKEKVYENYIEAYKDKQLIPGNLDIGNLVSHYQQAFDKAIATRKFVRELAEGNAKDGRPLAHTKGYIKTLTPDEASATKPVHFVKPRGSREEFADYVRGPENAAFRNWKWVESDAQGVQTFLEGEMYFHPEIAQKVKNIFGGSAIRKNVVGRGALKFAATMKGTLLDLSGFHQTQVGLHAIYHKVNPFNAPKIDVMNPLTKELIDSGTMIFDYHNANAFAEGVSGHGSLLHKIPGIGGYLDMYTDYLFKDYIPRLKMKMAHGAFERNMKIYGSKMSRGDIAKLTSDQANAAFGELNYAALGRNKTFQDVMRLGLLAPDFLEARARFAGQALQPKGREQFMAAVVRGSVITYSGARIVNALLNDGDPKWDKPFSLVIGDKEFLARSVPGDAYHLLKDWRSFIYHRLNPTMVRPVMEAVTSRVYTGRWVSPEDQLKDFFKAHIPIAFQRTADQKWWQSALNAMGVTAMDERSRALQEATKIRQRSSFAHPTKKSAEESKLTVSYIKELEKAKEPEERKEIMGRMREDVLAKKLSPNDVKKTLRESMYTPLQRIVKPMAIENALYIWTLADGKEKRSLVGLIQKKIPHLESTRREELMPTLVEFMLDVKALGEEDKKKQPDVFDKLEALSGKKVD